MLKCESNPKKKNREKKGKHKGLTAGDYAWWEYWQVQYLELSPSRITLALEKERGLID